MFIILQNSFRELEADIENVLKDCCKHQRSAGEVNTPPRAEDILLKISQITVKLEEIQLGIQKLIEEDLTETATSLVNEAPTGVIDLYKKSTKDKLIFLKELKQKKNRWYVFWKEMIDYSDA